MTEARTYDTPMQCVENVYTVGKLYAEAKSKRIGAENYRKTVRAIAFLKSTEKSVAAKEADALTCQAYQDECKKLEQAVLDEETYKHELKSAELKIEVWRSIQANKRQENIATGMTT